MGEGQTKEKVRISHVANTPFQQGFNAFRPEDRTNPYITLAAIHSICPFYPGSEEALEWWSGYYQAISGGN